MDLLGMTQGVCGECRTVVPTRVVTDGRDVYFHKFCPEHGESRSFVRSDVRGYLRSLRHVKPAWEPLEFAGDSKASCPEGCGLCDRHEQHLCLPIVEITSRCDLACPVCLVDAGAAWDMSLEGFRALLDALVRAERQVDVLNLSGGEPLVHPDLVAFVDEALSRPEVVRVSISTNGLGLLRAPDLVKRLHDRNVVVSLQFDGFDDRAYEVLRGRRLLEEKLRTLDLLCEEGVSTSLTMTAAGGVNDDQFRPMLDRLFSRENIVSMMIQPVAFAGRGASLSGTARRLSIPDVVRALGAAGHDAVASEGECMTLSSLLGSKLSLSFNAALQGPEHCRPRNRAEAQNEAGDDQRVCRFEEERCGPSDARAQAEHPCAREGEEDFAPLPCSHPLCFSLAFYLMLDGGGAVSVNGLVEASTAMDAMANRTVFGLDPQEHERLKTMIYELWSGPAGTAPDTEAVMKTLRAILKDMAGCCFDPRSAFTAAERRVKSIFIHAFQDADTFDLARVRRCCNAYPQPDGSLVPACVHNVLRRGQ